MKANILLAAIVANENTLTLASVAYLATLPLPTAPTFRVPCLTAPPCHLRFNLNDLG